MAGVTASRFLETFRRLGAEDRDRLATLEAAVGRRVFHREVAAWFWGIAGKHALVLLNGLRWAGAIKLVRPGFWKLNGGKS